MRAILTYHSIDPSGSVISVTPERFEQQVRWMASSGIPVVPLSELLALPADRDAIALTFDDAYVNFETHAWPRLREHGITATVFVPTAFVGRTNDWGALPGGGMPRLPILSWEALARLQEAGVILGAHARRHPDLRQLDDAALREEIDGSFDDVERATGHRPGAFAYPYGFISGSAVGRLQALGALGCTTDLRPLDDAEDPCLLPRLDSFYLTGPGRMEKFGTRTFGAYFRVRRALRSVRRRRQQPAAR